MESKYFTPGFLIIFILVIAGLFIVFWQISSSATLTDDTQVAIWSALTVLFVIFGIIIISLFMERIRNRPKAYSMYQE